MRALVERERLIQLMRGEAFFYLAVQAVFS